MPPGCARFSVSDVRGRRGKGFILFCVCSHGSAQSPLRAARRSDFIGRTQQRLANQETEKWYIVCLRGYQTDLKVSEIATWDYLIPQINKGIVCFRVSIAPQPCPTSPQSRNLTAAKSTPQNLKMETTVAISSTLHKTTSSPANKPF
jgi:hypothetical protein